MTRAKKTRIVVDANVTPCRSWAVAGSSRLKQTIRLLEVFPKLSRFFFVTTNNLTISKNKKDATSLLRLFFLGVVLF